MGKREAEAILAGLCQDASAGICGIVLKLVDEEVEVATFSFRDGSSGHGGLLKLYHQHGAKQAGFFVTHASLGEIRDENTVSAAKVGAPNTRNQKDTIIYRFTLSHDCIPHLRLMFAEDDDSKDQTQEHLVGGGTH